MKADVLINNLKALNTRSPALYSILEAVRKKADAEQFQFKLLAAKSGAISAMTGSLWLHSAYDPVKEALKAVKSLPDTDLLLVLGLGLGYVPRAAIDAEKRVAVIESNPAWLLLLFSYSDYTDLISSNKLDIILCPEGQGLLNYLEHRSPLALSVLENNATMQSFPEAAKLFRQQIHSYKERKEINTATLKRFGHLWVRNLIKNIKTTAFLPGLKNLDRVYNGLPALVLAAGPSLDAILPKLKALSERTVLICVDTALRSILPLGVNPDFVVVVDPQYWNSRHLDHCSLKNSILVAESAVYPSVLRSKTKLKLLCSSLYPLGSYFESGMGQDLLRLGAGGSVATTAWDLARVLGCSPIYMAGLDLSFPGTYSHARASYFEQKALYEASIFKPASTEAFTSYIGTQLVDEKANDGSIVKSDKRLQLYSSWFSNRAITAKGVSTYNLSGSGLEISGMPYIKSDSLLTMPKCRNQIDLITQKATAELIDFKTTEKQKINFILTDLQKDLKRIFVISERALKIAKKAKQLKSQELSAALDELDSIDTEVLNSPIKSLVAFLVSDLTIVLHEDSKETDNSLDKTILLYNLMAESSKFHYNCISYYT